jgi:hypothetical protein
VLSYLRFQWYTRMTGAYVAPLRCLYLNGGQCPDNYPHGFGLPPSRSVALSFSFPPASIPARSCTNFVLSRHRILATRRSAFPHHNSALRRRWRGPLLLRQNSFGRRHTRTCYSTLSRIAYIRVLADLSFAFYSSTSALLYPLRSVCNL